MSLLFQKISIRVEAEQRSRDYKSELPLGSPRFLERRRPEGLGSAAQPQPPGLPSPSLARPLHPVSLARRCERSNVITVVFKGCNRQRDGGPGHTALQRPDHISGRTGSVAARCSDNKITCPRAITPSHGSYALPPQLPLVTSQPNENGFPFQRAAHQRRARVIGDSPTL
jgi:hypothetical protein